MVRKFLTNALILSIISVLAVQPTYSEPVSISVSPLLIELSGEPGSRHDFVIKLSGGTGTNSTRVKATVVSVKQGSDGRYLVDQANNSPYSAASWFKLGTEQLEVEVGATTYLRGELTIPIRQRGGGYAGILLEPISSDIGQNDANMGVKIRTGFLVALEIGVTGAVRRQLHIEEVRLLSATQPGMEQISAKYGKNALLVSAVLNNDGNVHSFAKGTIIIRDSFGRKLRQIPLGGGRGVLMPGSRVEFASILTSGLPFGEYSLQVMVNYGASKPAVAKHSFSLGDVGINGGNVSHGVRFLAEPEKLDLDMRPGSFRTSVIRLQNLENEPIVVKMDIDKLGFNMEGEMDPEFGSTEFSAADWLKMAPEEVELQPGARRNVQISYRVPDDATGVHYALVRFAGALRDDKADNTTEEYSQIYLVPEKVGSPKFAVIKADLSKQPATGNFMVTIMLQNTGSMHGVIPVKWRLSKKEWPTQIPGVQYVGEPNKVLIAEGSFNELLGPVLPLESRLLSTVFPQPAMAGDYVIDIGLAYDSILNIVKSIDVKVE